MMRLEIKSQLSRNPASTTTAIAPPMRQRDIPVCVWPAVRDRYQVVNRSLIAGNESAADMAAMLVTFRKGVNRHVFNESIAALRSLSRVVRAVRTVPFGDMPSNAFSICLLPTAVRFAYPFRVSLTPLSLLNRVAFAHSRLCAVRFPVRQYFITVLSEVPLLIRQCSFTVACVRRTLARFVALMTMGNALPNAIGTQTKVCDRFRFATSAALFLITGIITGHWRLLFSGDVPRAIASRAGVSRASIIPLFPIYMRKETA